MVKGRDTWVSLDSGSSEYCFLLWKEYPSTGSSWVQFWHFEAKALFQYPVKSWAVGDMDLDLLEETRIVYMNLGRFHTDRKLNPGEDLLG